MTTRRDFIKTLLAATSGFYLLSMFSFQDNSKLIPEPLSNTFTAEKLQAKPRDLSISKENKPFLNALNHIITPTYDHTGQAVHPSVVDFKTEHNIESWGGFRYWMALTPYPSFNSTHENPSILVSKDGINWSNPPSMANPLATKPLGSSNNHYNSDPELVFDPDQNALILYWRECLENSFEKIWARKISSNYELSDKFLCIEKDWDYKKTGLILSPTVWRKDANEWFMWMTDGRMTVRLFTSSNGISWSTGQTCTAPWDSWNGGYVPWHIAAKPNYLEQTIEFLIAGWPIQKALKDCQLLYAVTPMSNPKDFSMPFLRPLLTPGAMDQWDNGYIYRSSFVREHGDNPKFHIWYSACSKNKVWHIGLTDGTMANMPSITSQI